jgi:hypothetical protein
MTDTKYKTAWEILLWKLRMEKQERGPKKYYKVNVPKRYQRIFPTSQTITKSKKT